MKKVLFIIHSPGVSERIKNQAKYLSEFGWEPLILSGQGSGYNKFPLKAYETAPEKTPRLMKLAGARSGGEAEHQIENQVGARARARSVGLLFHLGGEFINYPSHDKNWIPSALKTAVEIIEKEGDIDAIISSSPPVSSHIAARELKRQFKIPWIADFRDLWSQNHNYNYSRFRRWFDRKLERKTLADADMLLTVSEPWAWKLSTIHEHTPVHTITHGFDPMDINDPPEKLSAKFTITYTGTIYRDKQDPVKLLIALRELILNKEVDPQDLEVRFFGIKQNWLESEIVKLDMKKAVKQYGRVSAETARQKQRESQLLLLLDWDDPKENGLYTMKVFEYLGSRRPVLATGGISGNVIETLLTTTKSGVHAANVNDVVAAIKRYYQEYKLKGSVKYEGIESEINEYSHREIAGKLSKLLNQLIS